MRSGLLFTLGLLAVFLPLLACRPGVVTPVKTIDRATDGVSQLPVQLPADPSPNPSPEPSLDPSPRSDEVVELLAALDSLPIADRGSGVKYNRKDWPHWSDTDRDCQNTRAEVLIAESAGPVSFAPNDENEKCRVTGGQWRGPWSGELFTNAGDVDIDHHVPLGHAHESGGWDWDKARKRAYANDLDHPASLQATKPSLNRSKGKQPPDQWRPDAVAGWCRYGADWITVKSKWELTVTPGEVDALRQMLDTCDDAISWGLSDARER